MWKHGLRSIEVIERRRQMTAELRKLVRQLREEQPRVPELVKYEDRETSTA